MSSDTYKWCFLQNGNKETAGYIESRGAVVGYDVELPDLDGEFWKVTQVGKEVTREFVMQNQNKFKEFQKSLKGGGINE